MGFVGGRTHDFAIGLTMKKTYINLQPIHLFTLKCQTKQVWRRICCTSNSHPAATCHATSAALTMNMMAVSPWSSAQLRTIRREPPWWTQSGDPGWGCGRLLNYSALTMLRIAPGFWAIAKLAGCLSLVVHEDVFGGGVEIKWWSLQENGVESSP